MGKRKAEEVEAEEVDEAAALAEKKKAKKAKKNAAAAAAAAEEPAEEEVVDKKAAKKAKKAAAAAAAAAEAEAAEEEPAAEKKKAKKTKKAAAAAEAEPAEAEEAPEADAVAEKKKAKKAKKAAAAAAAAEAEEEEEAAPKKEKKKKKKAEEAEEEPEAEADAPKSDGGKGKGKDGKDGKSFDNENTVFARGLPFATTEDMLRKDFTECGEIVSLKMPLNDEGQCKGIAFIKFKSKEGCDKAIEFNETDYGGRTIYCSMAGDKGKDGKGKGKDGKGKDGKGKGKDGKGFDNENTVCVRGLPFATTEDALKKDFTECGEIVSLRMPLNDEGQCRGTAFIKYTAKEGCDKAIAFHETDYGGRTIYVSMAGEGGKGKDGKGKDGKGKDGGKGGFDNENTVCVKGLPFATTEEALKKDFTECGEIASLRMPLNEEGQCKGIAFIKYTSKEGSDKALAFNETDYGGRNIFVNMAGDGKGKDGKGKDKGKDKGKGKGKGKKGKAPSEAKAKSSGAMVESTGKKTAFEDSDSE